MTLQSQAGTVEIERVAAEKDEDIKDSKDSKDPKDEDQKDADDVLDAEPEGVWRMVRPLQARADTFAVDGLLESLANLERPAPWRSSSPGRWGSTGRAPPCA